MNVRVTRSPTAHSFIASLYSRAVLPVPVVWLPVAVLASRAGCVQRNSQNALALAGSVVEDLPGDCAHTIRCEFPAAHWDRVRRTSETRHVRHVEYRVRSGTGTDLLR